MKVYVAQIVRELRHFYADYIYELETYQNVYAHLEAIVNHMYYGVRQNLPCIKKEISNYHKDYLGKEELILAESFTLDDCKQTVANEYGFLDWSAIEQLSNVQYNYQFERAVNYLLEGNKVELMHLIDANPKLVAERSRYGHQATLLHYAGSNGIELWRQQVPLNLPEIATYLLESGADRSATMKVYGGEHDTYALLTTSIHPKEAGIMDEIKNVLKPRV